MRTGRDALRFRPTCLAISVSTAVLVAVVGTTTVLACPVCLPPVRATVTGSGLRGTISISDPTALAGIATTTLPGFDPRAPIAEPANLGQGYEVVRYYQPIGGQTTAPNPTPLAYDHFLYYPAAASLPAVYLYEGPTVQDAQTTPQFPPLDTMAGKWYAANQAEIAAMQALLVAARVPLPATATPTSPARGQSQRQTALAWWQQTNWLLVVPIVAGFALLAGALVLLRRQDIPALPISEPEHEREETPARR